MVYACQIGVNGLCVCVFHGAIQQVIKMKKRIINQSGRIPLTVGSEPKLHIW